MIMNILYMPQFLRQYKKLEPDLQEEVKRSIARFRTDPAEPSLRAHKLKGSLTGFMSFSVNYQYRIVYQWRNTDTIVLLKVGNHAVYR